MKLVTPHAILTCRRFGVRWSMVWDIPKLLTLLLVILLIWSFGFLFGVGNGLERGARKHCNEWPLARQEECVAAFVK